MFLAVIISIGFFASIVLGAAIVIALRKMSARAQARLIARQQPTPPAGAPPPPAAQPAATPPVAAAAISWGFLWKVLKIALVVVAGLALMLGAYWLLSQNGLTANWSVDLETQQTVQTLAIYVVTILICVVVLVWLFRRPKPSVGFKFPKAGELLTSFMVFALVLYAMHGTSPNADLFKNPEGWVTIVVYGLAMITAAMVALNLKKGAWFSAAVGMFIFFALTGARSWMLLNSDGVFAQRTHIAAIGEWWNSDRSIRQVLVPPPAPTTYECNGVPATETYQPGTHNVNGNFCQLRAYVISGCVTWLDVNQTPLAKTCNGPMPTVSNIINIRAESVAVVRLNHCRNYASGNLVDVCG